MPAWIIVTAAAAVLLALWAAYVRRYWHALRYSMRRARHLADLTQTEAIPGAEYIGAMMAEDEPWLTAPPVDPDPWLTRRVPMHTSRLSMLPVECHCAAGGPCVCGCHVPDWREQTRAELSPETLGVAHIDPRAIRHCPEHGAAICIHDDPGPGGGAASSPDFPAIPGPDWREQTAADLSPEALDSDVQPDPYLDAIAAEHGSEYDPGEVMPDADTHAELHLPGVPAAAHVSSGPGGLSSLTPGPDWLDGQLAVLYEWVRAQYAAAAA